MSNYIFNYPIETPEAIRFWSSEHKCNTAQAFVAFSLDEENYRELAKRHGYTREWRDRVWSAFGSLVNQPDMQGGGFDYKEMEDLWWVCMPNVASSPLVKPEFVACSSDVQQEDGETATISVVFNFAETYAWYYIDPIDGSHVPMLVDVPDLDVPVGFFGEFFCRASNSIGDTDSHIINVIETGDAPVITDQPDDLIVIDTNDATFSADADNYDSAQWFTRGTALEGETDPANLTLVANAHDNGKTFHCAFTNKFGTTHTSAAALDVIRLIPVITEQPVTPPNAFEFVPFLLEVTAANADSYQWFRADERGRYHPIEGETDAEVNITEEITKTFNGKTMTSQFFHYYVEVTNRNETIRSNIVNVLVTVSEEDLPPYFRRHPQDQAPFEFANVTFLAQASDPSGEDSELEYGWQLNGTEIPDEDSNTLTFEATLSQDGAQFTAVATSGDTGLSATSESATLTVVPLPVIITEQPVGDSVIPGDTITLSVEATHPTNTFFYQWEIESPGGWIGVGYNKTYDFTTYPGALPTNFRCRVRAGEDDPRREAYSDVATVITYSDDTHIFTPELNPDTGAPNWGYNRNAGGDFGELYPELSNGVMVDRLYTNQSYTVVQMRLEDGIDAGVMEVKYNDKVYTFEQNVSNGRYDLTGPDGAEFANLIKDAGEAGGDMIIEIFRSGRIVEGYLYTEGSEEGWAQVRTSQWPPFIVHDPDPAIIHFLETEYGSDTYYMTNTYYHNTHYREAWATAGNQQRQYTNFVYGLSEQTGRQYDRELTYYIPDFTIPFNLIDNNMDDVPSVGAAGNIRDAYYTPYWWMNREGKGSGEEVLFTFTTEPIVPNLKRKLLDDSGDPLTDENGETLTHNEITEEDMELYEYMALNQATSSQNAIVVDSDTMEEYMSFDNDLPAGNYMLIFSLIMDFNEPNETLLWKYDGDVVSPEFRKGNVWATNTDTEGWSYAFEYVHSGGEMSIQMMAAKEESWENDIEIPVANISAYRVS